MKFKLNPIAIAILAAQALFYPATGTQAATLGSYSPQANDNLIGSLSVYGSSETLTGNPRFSTGTDGAVNSTLGQVNIVAGAQFLNQTRLDPGPQNFAITVPDPTTGGNTTFQVYNPASLAAQTPVTGATAVPDVVNVNGNQYINTRIADVINGGTLAVNIGQANAVSSASTNSWSMAAKQTTLFQVASNSTLSWNSNNRISFFGSTATPDGASATQTFQVQNLASYKGSFMVQTLDGATHPFSVTDARELQSYNNWLISQLRSGNLNKANYLTEFNKAVTVSNGSILYNVSATPPDEVTRPQGNRIVVNADGSNARVNLAAGNTLEVVGSTSGAIKASNGAQAVLDGKLATNSDTALVLSNNSSGSAAGVINAGFLNRQDGTGIGSSGYGGSGVLVQSGSQFNNTGIVNLATTGSNSLYGVAGIRLEANATSSNSGNINVGVNGSSARGTASGVLLTTPTSTFTNNANGQIYIGRGAQNRLTDVVADTAMNQSGLTSGIALVANGSATNNGIIVIGSRVQNAAGMSASGANNVTMINNGTINVNGAAATVPRENVAMAVTNSSGNIDNRGTINLNGVNGSGVKVVATNANRASANSSGTINVAGGADPASGTRNFGVWVEGQGTGQATADINGPVNLTGIGAIGVHARGNARVEVAANAVPSFSNGSNQIAFFAYGPNALINVAGNNPFDVTTRNSTLFRVEQGADFDGTNLSLTASGAGSVAVNGSGSGGTEVNTRNATLNVSGVGATGVNIEGGATGMIDGDTTINLTGNNAIGAIVDGQKHTLAGSNSGAPVSSTRLNSAATLNSTQTGLIGYLVRNGAQLNNTGDITFSGANATGIRVESGATASNSGDISINDGGTGIAVNSSGSSANTSANNSGNINVNGGSRTNRSRGVSADGSQAVASLNSGSLNLNGSGAIGAEALNGALVNIAAGSAPQFNNSDQIAWHAAGSGSRINSAANALDVNTSNSTGYRIDDGAALSFSAPTALTTSGVNSTAVIVSGNGSRLDSANTRFTASGEGSTAMRVEGGANATLASDSSINLSGSNTLGVLVNNLHTDLSNALDGSSAATTVTSNGNLNGSGSNATGFDVSNGATLLHNGAVNLTGNNNDGIRLGAGSTLTNNGTVNITNGTGLDVSGSGSTLAKGGVINVDNGVAGVRIRDGAQLAPSGSETVITTRGHVPGRTAERR